MTNNDTNFLEALKLARELVIQEYQDMRGKAHNKWVIDSTILWNTRRIKLPYPDLPPFPSDNDIISRAKILVGFINSEPNINNDLEDTAKSNNGNCNITATTEVAAVEQISAISAEQQNDYQQNNKRSRLKKLFFWKH